MPAEQPKRPFEVYDELLERILTEVPERAKGVSVVLEGLDLLLRQLRRYDLRP